MQPGALEAQDIASDLLIAFFVSPKGEGDGHETIYFRHRQAVFGQVDGDDVSPASVAGFHPDGIELGRGIDAELFLTSLVARRAGNAQIIPFGPAE